MVRTNPNLIKEIKKLGAFDITACYSCGECTAICPLSENNFELPRMMIRYSILGLEDKLLSSPQLWLCYYCGECSESCPRDADPGALMMAARRYAIIKYSLGGIARIFYSKVMSVVSLIILSIIAALGIYLFKKPLDLTKFNPFSLLSYEFIHTAGLVLAAYIAIVALLQGIKMYNCIKHSALEGNLSAGAKVKNLIKSFFIMLFGEVLAERRYLKCDRKNRYIAHMTVFWGFVLMFIATTLDYLKNSNILGLRESYEIIKAINIEIFGVLARIIGIIGGLIGIYGSIYFIYKRLVKDDVYSEYSHVSDWIFLILISLGILTGFLIDIFIYTNMPLLAYVMFAIHLIFVFDLIVTAPFTKFAHLGYRLIAVWFYEYQKLKLSK
ncbi:MAG: 4Fe-4S dicluster domain-containing protein [Candidatus Njordarchaeales archaeon]